MQDVSNFEAVGFNRKQAGQIVLFVRSVESLSAKQSSLPKVRQDFTEFNTESASETFTEVKKGIGGLDLQTKVGFLGFGLVAFYVVAELGSKEGSLLRNVIDFLLNSAHRLPPPLI